MVSRWEKPYFVLSVLLCSCIAVAYGFVRFAGDLGNGPSWFNLLVLAIVAMSALLGRHVGALQGEHAFVSTPARSRIARSSLLAAAIVLAGDAAGVFDRWIPGRGVESMAHLDRAILAVWMVGAMYAVVALAVGPRALFGRLSE